MTKRALIQIALWVIFFLFWYQIVYSYVGDIVNRLLFTFFDVALIIASFYFVYAFAVPKLLLKKKRILFIVTVIAAIVASSFLLIWILKSMLNYDLFRIRFIMSWNFKDLYNTRFSVALFGTIAGLVTKLSFEWIQAKKRIQEIEYEKTKAELNYLKNQVNPHFLFNALNTIYFQLDESTDNARSSLLKFSDILRYQLYECNDDYVPVIKEMEYLDNYIKIQTMRKESNYAIDFSFDTTWTSEKIAPLLLIPFVEDAFKYVSNFSEQQNSITIAAAKKGNCMFFSCNNSFNETVITKPGLGIGNVKRRLELVYPGRHTLDITARDNYFTVLLKIGL